MKSLRHHDVVPPINIDMSGIDTCYPTGRQVSNKACGIVVLLFNTIGLGEQQQRKQCWAILTIPRCTVPRPPIRHQECSRLTEQNLVNRFPINRTETHKMAAKLAYANRGSSVTFVHVTDLTLDFRLNKLMMMMMMTLPASAACTITIYLLFFIKL